MAALLLPVPIAAVLPADDEDAEAARRRTARRERRIKRQLRLGREGELNIVSMIDVFAVLVFFLLVTASITAARLNVLALDLPGKSAATARPLARPSVTVLDGALLVDIGNGQSQRHVRQADGRALAALPGLLLAAKRLAPGQDAIDLLVGAEVPYADVVAVIDAMRRVSPEALRAGYPGELFPRLAVGDAGGDGR